MLKQMLINSKIAVQNEGPVCSDRKGSVCAEYPIELTSQLSNDSGEIKKPVLSNLEDKTGLVPRKRLELSRLAAYAPQAYLYTIPTPGLSILPNSSSDKH